MAEPKVAGTHMVVVLDGHEVGTVAYLTGGKHVRSITEGDARFSLKGSEWTSVAQVEPYVVETGLLRPMADWIDATLSKRYSRREFELRQGRGERAASFRAYDCMITEIAFPALDRRSSGDALLKLKVQPERVQSGRTGVQRRNSPPMLPLSGGKFRLAIDGALDGTEVQRVDPFSFRLGMRTHYLGTERALSVEPAKLEMPRLSIQVGSAQARRLKEWGDATLVDGRPGAMPPRNGRLELFTRSGSHAATLQFGDMHLTSLQQSNGASTTVVLGMGSASLRLAR